METTGIESKTSFVNFKVGTELFAVQVNRVLEIIQLEYLTFVPNTSDLIKGVLNFRGSIVPVIDMEKRFNVISTENKEKMVIVVEVKNKDNSILMGLQVDEVTNVIEFSNENIRPVPDLGIKCNSDFLEGMVENNESFIMILNLDKVLNVDTLAEICEVSEV